jgi:hypothetical protein
VTAPRRFPALTNRDSDKWKKRPSQTDSYFLPRSGTADRTLECADLPRNTSAIGERQEQPVEAVTDGPANVVKP